MLSQIAAITGMNLRNIRARLGASLIIVIGMAGVVAVLIGLLAMSTGFRAALARSGAPDRAVILRDGATQEMNSWVDGDDLAVVAQLDGIVAASGEIFVALDLPTRATGRPGAAVGRGVQWSAFDVRPELEIVAGRRFQPGHNEMIAGTAAVDEYLGLDIGDHVVLRDSTWTVVGHFDGAGSAYATEVWMDLAQAQGTFRRQGGVSTVRVRLENASLAPRLRKRIESDPRLELDVITEPEWYVEQSRARAELIEAFAVLVAGIMALGAVIAALNTMYSAVGARTIEIATLRALGFGNVPIVASVLVEALVLALAGGLVGGALVYLALDGHATSTLNTQAYSQVAFQFAVTPRLILMGACSALILGLIGGLLPAIRAARLPILAALRSI